MKPWKKLATAQTPGGGRLELQEHDGEFVIRVDGQVLMSSRTKGSETAMAELACAAIAKIRAPRVLIGGLGLGFTLRAALDALPPGAFVELAEISPAIVEWNRTLVPQLAGAPLEDSRVKAWVGDVRKAFSRGPWDAILLDVDNGPTALTRDANDSLYDETGLHLARSAFRKGGVLVIWSAGNDSRFVTRLEKAGFAVEVKETAAHQGRGARHVLFFATAR